MALSHTLVLLAVVAGSFAEVANFLPCNNATTTCTVTEVRISPCPNPIKQCSLKTGHNASISFDFTPKFVASNLRTSVTWPDGPGGEVAFAGLENHDACGLTSCPTVADASQAFDYNLYLGKKLPKGNYQIKWLLWNTENNQENCCFLTKIQLRR